MRRERWNSGLSPGYSWNQVSRSSTGVQSMEPTQSMPWEKKSLPSGSTSHHLPWYFSVRKKPVARSAGPAAHPPHWFHSAGPGFAFRSAASSARRCASSSREWTLPGQSRWMYCPKVSMKGKNLSASGAGGGGVKVPAARMLSISQTWSSFGLGLKSTNCVTLAVSMLAFCSWPAG